MSRSSIETSVGSRLIQALAGVRLRVRLLLVLDGLGQLAFWLMAMFGLVVFLDWWVHFPGYIRTVLLGTALILTSWHVYRRIVRPALAPISLEEIALSLGRLTPDAKERLASAVEYLEHKADGSDDMWSRVLDNATASANAVPLRRGLSPGRAVRSGLAGAGMLAAALVFRLVVPDTAQIAWSRVLLPLGTVQWPRSIQIVPITRDVLVPHGESFTAELRLARGDDRIQRAFIEVAPVSGKGPRQLMRRDPDGVFRYTVENVRVPMQYTFFAGDDDTRDRPFRIGVVARPEVASCKAHVLPPAYAAGGAVSTLMLGDEPIAAVKGSRIRIEALSNKDLGAAAPGHVNALAFDDGVIVPLAPTPGDARVWQAEFDAVQSGAFEIRLTDEHGFETRGGRRYALVVQEDQPPRVSVVEPVDEIELTPQGSLRLLVQAVDDFGLTGCRLMAAVNAAPVALVDELPVPGAAHAGAAATSVSVELEHLWAMTRGDRAVQPGDRVEYAVEVTDNFDLDGRRHDPVRSAARHIRIVTAEELAEILRQSLVGLRGTLRHLSAGLKNVRDQTGQLDQDPSRSLPLSVAHRDQAFRLARELDRLREASDAMVERFDGIIQRAAENHASQLDVALQARRLGRRLASATDVLSRTASEALAAAGRADQAAEQHERLAESLANQDALLAALEETLGELDRWNDYQELVRQTRELLDRQESTMREAARLAGRLAGRAAEELTTTERTDLDRIELTQREIADESRSLIEAMIRTASILTLSDLAAADALQRAAETAHAQGLTPSMHEAADHLHENRIHRANESQDRACATVRAMLAAFEDKPERELATLSRETRELAEQIERLIKTQTQLIERTERAAREGAGEDEVAQLGDRQASLGKTTRRLAERSSDREHESRAAREELSVAATHMGAAAAALDELQPAAAQPTQREALGALEAALAVLKDLAAQTEELLAERSLEAIRRQLAQLRETQTQIRSQTADIGGRAANSPELSRADRVRLARLAQLQGEMSKPFEEVIARLEASPVYAHVVNAAAADAARAAELLTRMQPGDALSRQSSVIQRLTWLIAAVDDRPPRTGNRFVSAEAGGGGASAPTMEKPVPALAELKVLRVLQQDLNQRTRAVAVDTFSSDGVSRAEATESLAITQAEIHALSMRMVEQASKAGGP